MTDEESYKQAVRARYERALSALIDTLKQDRTILAAILCGSLAYDEVWEKSDIDLLVIGDETHKEKSYTLVEEGVNIHATISPRSAFKKAIEGSLQSSFFHSLFSKSRLLYTHDESLVNLYENIHKIGDRDRSYQMMSAVTGALFALPKAEKWYRIKHDLHYAFLYILFCAGSLAKVEMISRGEITGREVIQQALKVNPTFFRRIYTDLIDGPKDEAAIAAALEAINGYLDERITLIFQPVLDYLTEAGGPRSATEINDFFKKTAGEGAAFACEWLADKGVIEKVSAPLRLSDKSRVAVNEAAYYYDAG
jgi:predicted nucleotidyltransferase